MGAYDAVILPRWRPQKTVKVEEAVARTVVKVPNPKTSEGTQMSEPSRVLELFSGTGSVGQVFADEGYEVVSVDNNPKEKPSIVVNILTWKYQDMFPVGHFDIIFACTPCEQVSQARTTFEP